MKNQYLIVVDMQKDFVDGSLGTAEAVAIVPAVVEKVKNFEGHILFTKDTHFADYLSTSEGRMLPVEHCIKDTEGWQLIQQLADLCEQKNAKIYEKPTFGCKELAQDLFDIQESEPIDFIEVIGLCTDICVVSNVLMIKAYLPEVPIRVDASCCAGVTPEKHEAALETMRSCQIEVVPSKAV